MAGGATARLHPSKRHNNPLVYKSGKPRLRTLNIEKLTALIEKTQRKKDQAKITREIARQTTMKATKLTQGK
jgi:hypothetical protein